MKNQSNEAEFKRMRALVAMKNQSSVFAQSSVEAQKLVNGRNDLSIDTINSIFTFKTTGYTGITVSPKTSTISGLEYINDISINDIDNAITSVNSLGDRVTTVEESLDSKADVNNTTLTGTTTVSQLSCNTSSDYPRYSWHVCLSVGMRYLATSYIPVVQSVTIGGMFDVILLIQNSTYTFYGEIHLKGYFNSSTLVISEYTSSVYGGVPELYRYTYNDVEYFGIRYLSVRTGCTFYLTGYTNITEVYNVYESQATNAEVVSVSKNSITTSAITLNGSDLSTTLDGKSNTDHTHGISDVNELQTTLDSKADVNDPTFTGTVTISATDNNDTNTITNASMELVKYYESDDVQTHEYHNTSIPESLTLSYQFYDPKEILGTTIDSVTDKMCAITNGSMKLTNTVTTNGSTSMSYSSSMAASEISVSDNTNDTSTSIHPFGIYTPAITLDGTDLKAYILNMTYPVGAVYTSTVSTSPATLFGGTWTQITSRFLYCTTTSLTTGGSTSITSSNLPSHTHSFSATTGSGGSHSHSITVPQNTTGYPDGGSDTSTSYGYWRKTTSSTTGTASTHTHSVSGTSGSTGSGSAYYPPYMTVYAWYRTA